MTFLHKILYKFGGQDEWPSSGGEYILDIKGFLRPYQIPYDDNIQLKLLVNNGKQPTISFTVYPSKGLGYKTS